MEKIRSYLLIAISFFFSEISGQNTISFKERPTAAAIDLSGNYFIAFSNGTLRKFDRSGVELVKFSLPTFSQIDFIDAQNPLRTFLFSFDNQQIILLDRFNTIPKTYQIADFGVELVTAACPASDRAFWILENNPVRLKKIDPLLNQTMLEVQLDEVDEVVSMSVYKSILIIVAPDAIHVYDRFGALLNQIKLAGVRNLQNSKNSLLIHTATETFEYSRYENKLTQLPTKSGEQALFSFFRKDSWTHIFEDKMEILLRD